MTYNYGIIGNCKTAALVGDRGNIDWFCYPNFDRPSVFAKLLDKEKGGSFSIEPIGKYKTRQFYRKNTNILETTFYNKENSFKIVDFFVKYKDGDTEFKEPSLHRYVKVIRGNPKVRIVFNPKLNYAKGRTKLSHVNCSVLAKNKGKEIYLHTNLDTKHIFNKETVKLPKESYFILDSRKKINGDLKHMKESLKKTQAYWKDFVSRGKWPRFCRNSVIRSALTLKLLTYEDSGAVIAAPTTSLPEVPGKRRNWDYRYCWLRDSSFTIDALTKINHFDEAEDFFRYLKKVVKACDINEKTCKVDVKVMYGIEEKTILSEKILKHLSGYKNSKPVRIGNSAYRQRQIDTAGEVLNTLYEIHVKYKYKKTIDPEIWEIVNFLVQYVILNWKKKDSGIWEFRGNRQNFTFSKLLSWVALDKAIKIAEHYNKRGVIKHWEKEREKIRDYVMQKCFNAKKEVFTAYPKTDFLDSSVLLMAYYGFINPKEEAFRKTVKEIEKILANDCLVRRYDMPDDFEMSTTAFTICSLWFIDSLYLIGEKRKARALFKKLMSYGNHLKLFSEGIETRSKSLTGNFPQAYTHVGVINTAFLIGNGG